MHLTRALVAVAAVAVAALPWFAFPREDARANHSWPANDQKHVYYQHWDALGHGALDEDVCVTAYSGLTQATAVARVNDTLLVAAPRWDRPNGDLRIDIWMSATDCYTLESQGTDGMIEIKYYVGHPNTASECLGSTFSCVKEYRPVPTVNPTHSYLMIAWMRASDVGSGNYRKNLNHETGHIWDLKDPDYENQFYDGCFSAQDLYTYSVMHQYAIAGYCSTAGGYPVTSITYPTVQDFATVISNKLPTH